MFDKLHYLSTLWFVMGVDPEVVTDNFVSIGQWCVRAGSHCKLWELELWVWMVILSFSCSSLLPLTAQLGLFTWFIYSPHMKSELYSGMNDKGKIKASLTEILTVLKMFYFPFYLISLLVLNILFTCVLQDILHPVRMVKKTIIA